MRTPLLLLALAIPTHAFAQPSDPGSLDALSRLDPGRTKAVNALWIENPLTAQFKTSRQVVVAEIPGPAVITMIHFAVPQSHFGQPLKMLNRDLLLRAFWDGEDYPSVEAPLVDFFGDPAGLRESLDTALVNKRRGFNAYFPMPFRRSARIELVYDGPTPPGDELWRIMPCYSYVMYRTLDTLEPDRGYFHAHWRQAALLLARQDYLALEAKGRGKFVGWNVTVRTPGREAYPVDENEKFFIDGEAEPSVEFQGLEDSFGFSWGFPETESTFPLTGFFKFLKGAAAYRFFTQDAISFETSLRVGIGFGKNEDPMFHQVYARRGNELQLSSTVYWYQTEPHLPVPPILPADQRAPAPDDRFWQSPEQLPEPAALRERGVKLHLLCGRPEREVFFAEPGYGANFLQAYAYSEWPPPIYHTRADDTELRIELQVPTGAKGKVRLFAIDPDDFGGGRKQTVLVAGRTVKSIERFQDGIWLEHAVGPADTAQGKVLIQARNENKKGNAVISILEWVED